MAEATSNDIRLDLIYGGQATLEDLYILNRFGFEFVVASGAITSVIKN